jgi:hypothetical protein
MRTIILILIGITIPLASMAVGPKASDEKQKQEVKKEVCDPQQQTKMPETFY